jgi:hypothetical protein
MCFYSRPLHNLSMNDVVGADDPLWDSTVGCVSARKASTRRGANPDKPPSQAVTWLGARGAVGAQPPLTEPISHTAHQVGRTQLKTRRGAADRTIKKHLADRNPSTRKKGSTMLNAAFAMLAMLPVVFGAAGYAMVSR